MNDTLPIPPPPAGTSQWVLLAAEWALDANGVPVPLGPTHAICGEPSRDTPERPDTAICRERGWAPVGYVLVCGARKPKESP